MLKQTKKSQNSEVIRRVIHRVRGQNISCLGRKYVQPTQESYKR